MSIDMNNIVVASDLRWPAGTGIGLCQQEHIARIPDSISILDVDANLKVGSPLSPISVAYSMHVENKKKCNVFWSPGFVPPAWSSIPCVVTVHDLTHLHFYSKLHRNYYNIIFRPLYRKCESIICVSEYTKNELLDWSGIPSERVHVIYNGVSLIYHPDVNPFNPGYPYIFYPGNKRIYKNLGMLLRAFSVSILPQHGVKLIMTGSATDDLASIITELNLSDDVVFLGYVLDRDLPSLYRGAEFTTFISLYEGFGLPIVESMAVGTPVITSNISSMPEVAGDAALLVDPSNLENITEAMNKLLADASLRRHYITMGLNRSKDFTWDKSSSSTWKLIRDASSA